VSWCCGPLVGVQLDAIDEQAGQDRDAVRAQMSEASRAKVTVECEGKEELAHDAADKAERQEDRDRGPSWSW